MKEEEVILVDTNDNQTGVMEKMAAHHSGALHRAFSVFVFKSDGRVLLQKRAVSKYHSGGLWTNTCCGHPRPGEDVMAAAKRRLKEEMGMSCYLKYVFRFAYMVKLDNDITENEIDHVFFAVSDDVPVLNPEEASEYRYAESTVILNEIEKQPETYTEWFKIAFRSIVEPFIYPAGNFRG